MKKSIFLTMGIIAMALTSCKEQATEQPWVVDRFDDVKIIRYEVPEFENQSLNDKLLIYYLAESAKCGRDIMFDQNFKYNLTIRKMLETVYTDFKGDKADTNFVNMETYLKRVWFSNGIHHHYGCEKFIPGFTPEFFRAALKTVDATKLPLAQGQSVDQLCDEIFPIIFDPTIMPKRVNQADGEDLILTSAGNYYEGVTQKEVEKFYNDMIKKAGNDPCPISYGLNSKLVKENGKTYVVVNNFEGLRELFGKLLWEVQRIKSEGDFEAARKLVETYGVHIEYVIHKEILERYETLNIAPYKGFINPVYTAVKDADGNITDVTVSYTEGYAEQMLRYSKDYSVE